MITSSHCRTLKYTHLNGQLSNAICNKQNLQGVEQRITTLHVFPERHHDFMSMPVPATEHDFV